MGGGRDVAVLFGLGHSSSFELFSRGEITRWDFNKTRVKEVLGIESSSNIGPIPGRNDEEPGVGGFCLWFGLFYY